MKYFLNADERAASGHEDYVEFRSPAATEEFWDMASLYMPETVMDGTGFGAFWSDCMCDGTVFDMDTITPKGLSQMVGKAVQRGGAVLEVIEELKAWLEPQLTGEDDSIAVIWADDRALARRKAAQNAYPVDPEFYREVQAIDEGLTFAEQEEAYESLLRKYHMPDCFFPFPLYEPDKWN